MKEISLTELTELTQLPFKAEFCLLCQFCQNFRAEISAKCPPTHPLFYFGHKMRVAIHRFRENQAIRGYPYPMTPD